MISRGWDALTHLQQCSKEADAPLTSLQHRYWHIFRKERPQAQLTSGFGETPLPWTTLTFPSYSPLLLLVLLVLFLLNDIPCDPVHWGRCGPAEKTHWTTAWRSSKGKERREYRDRAGIEEGEEGEGGWVQGGCRLFWNRLCEYRETWRAPAPGG